MCQRLLLLIFILLSCSTYYSYSQSTSHDIYSDYVLFQKRARLDKDLRENIVGKAFNQKLDSNNEHRFESACLAVSQFLFDGQEIRSGFRQLFNEYNWLQPDTKRAFLEAVYAVDLNEYSNDLQSILTSEADPLLFSMATVYLLRNDSSVENQNQLKIKMVERFPGYDSVDILLELERYINNYVSGKRRKTPDLVKLFERQRLTGRKIIYSLQRWNRDFPGLAIIQHANGKFARDANGRLLVFQQLARSASNLPYFITNGSTPQGIFSLQGSAVSKINWIGPTPNLQMIMPFEDSWERFYHQPLAPSQDSSVLYKQLLPASWRNHDPMMESWHAGKVGRSEIIAHGTTIDPEYYAGKPFYPLTPTMGCLCAREQWNVTTGRLLLSEQYGLMSTYSSSPGPVDSYMSLISTTSKDPSPAKN